MNKFIEGLMANLFGSYRTTITGWLAGIAILIPQARALLDADAATEVDFTQVSLGLGMLGLGSLARDNGVSSEEAGAK